MQEQDMLTADLARAARAFTKVSVGTIADSAGLTRQDVRDFEKGVRDLPADAKQRLKESLEKYGAHFIPEDEELGYGVRRKYTREKLFRLNTWDSEGGHPPEL